MAKSSKNLTVWLVKITPARGLGIGVIAFLSLFLTFTMGVMIGKDMTGTMPENNGNSSAKSEAGHVPAEDIKQDIEIPDPRELSFYETLSKKKSDAFRMQEKGKIKDPDLSKHQKTIKNVPVQQSPQSIVQQKMTQKNKDVYTVQILSLKSEPDAHIFMKKLKENGIDSEISSVIVSKIRWHRVSSGEFNDLKNARKHAIAIKSKIKGVNPIVTKLK